MSLIRGKDTKPEILVRKFLHRQGLRFRLHRRDLVGSPDIVLPKYGVAIFVQGCFWHAHHCQKGRIPKTRSAFWAEKLGRNRRRDTRYARELRKQGWRVFQVWECELTKASKRERVLSRLEQRIRAGH